MKFTIEPFVGPLPLRFGMSAEEVRAILGPPVIAFPDHFGNPTENRENVNVGYSAADGALVEVVFTPGTTLLYQGQNLFLIPDPIGLLRQADSNPQLWVGDLIFLKLGLGMSGFHDHDESQKAISLVRRGHWDEYKNQFEPYRGSPNGDIQ